MPPATFGPNGSRPVDLCGRQFSWHFCAGSTAVYIADDTLADIAMGNSIHCWFEFPIQHVDLHDLKFGHSPSRNTLGSRARRQAGCISAHGACDG